MGVSSPENSQEQLGCIEAIFDPDQSMSKELLFPLLEMSLAQIESLFSDNLKSVVPKEIPFKNGTYHIEMVTTDNQLCTIVFRPFDGSFYIDKKLPDHQLIEDLSQNHDGLKLTMNGMPAFEPNRGKIVKLFF